VQKIPSNQFKKLQKPKSLTLNRPNKSFNKQLEQTPLARQSRPNNTLSKELRIWAKVLRKERVTRDQHCKKKKRMSQKDGRTQSRVPRIFTTTQQRKRVNWGVLPSKLLDKKQNKQAKL
jgi:hypothetical protein